MDLYPLILQSAIYNKRQSSIQPEMLKRLMLISIEGHSVADFDIQSACNRWWTTTFKASWIQSTLYDYRLDWPAIRETNLEMDD
jgi:hypothetical protein